MLNLLSYVIMPIYTLLFSRNYDLFTFNFSVIGNLSGQKGHFLLWGILLGLCLGYILSGVSKNLNLSGWMNHLITAALITLMASITTPYLPHKFPFKAILHVLLAALSALLLILYLFLASAALYQLNPAAGKAALFSLCMILSISLFLLFVAGIISSALEIYFTISAIFLSRFILQKSQPSYCS